MMKVITLINTVALAAAGFFFLASGVYTMPGPNWFGQFCWVLTPLYCIRPVSFGVGGGLLVAAFLFHRHRDKQ